MALGRCLRAFGEYLPDLDREFLSGGLGQIVFSVGCSSFMLLKRVKSLHTCHHSFRKAHIIDLEYEEALCAVHGDTSKVIMAPAQIEWPGRCKGSVTCINQFHRPLHTPKVMFDKTLNNYKIFQAQGQSRSLLGSSCPGRLQV